jgi:inhibitor of cysteine peptidase
MVLRQLLLPAIVMQVAMPNLVLTDVDATSTHDVGRGETIELRLPENPTTGYRWSLDVEPPGASAVTGSRFETGGPGIGAGGMRIFTIAINGLGAVKLQAKLWREWEGEGSTIQRHTFALQVH